jgi:hypothetical protein
VVKHLVSSGGCSERDCCVSEPSIDQLFRASFPFFSFFGENNQRIIRDDSEMSSEASNLQLFFLKFCASLEVKSFPAVIS